jgi:HSP20 family protein
MITRYDPFREALSLRRAMDQLFEQSFVNPGLMAGSPSLMVAMDICESTNGYEVDVALPGVRAEDIELVVDQNSLTLRGRYGYQSERENQPQGQTQSGPSQQQSQQAQQGKVQRQQQQQGRNWLSREIVSGSFERTITFPKPVDSDNIQTTFQNGILTIMVPVSEASRPKRIKVQSQTQPTTVVAGRS